MLGRIGAVVQAFLINDYMPWLGTAIAIASFFFIHNYDPRLGIIGTAMKGEIYLSDPPPDFSQYGSLVVAANNPFADLIPDPSVKLPYRYVLASCLFMIGVNLGARRKSSVAENGKS